MKTQLLCIFIFSLAASCQTAKKAEGPITVKTAPYVLLSNGKKVDARKVTEATDLIFADSQVYAKSDVSFYCDGEGTFARIKKEDFVKKIIDGDICIYFGNYHGSTSTLMPPTKDFPHYYWQPASYTFTPKYITHTSSKTVERLNYSNLQKYIPVNTPGHPSLEQYKKAIHNSTRHEWVALGVVGGGILLGNAEPAHKSQLIDVVSSYIVIGGIATASYGLLHKLHASRHLDKAVAEHNAGN